MPRATVLRLRQRRAPALEPPVRHDLPASILFPRGKRKNMPSQQNAWFSANHGAPCELAASEIRAGGLYGGLMGCTVGLGNDHSASDTIGQLSALYRQQAKLAGCPDDAWVPPLGPVQEWPSWATRG
jgi:hypothetical protein